MGQFMAKKALAGHFSEIALGLMYIVTGRTSERSVFETLTGFQHAELTGMEIGLQILAWWRHSEILIQIIPGPIREWPSNRRSGSEMTKRA